MARAGNTRLTIQDELVLGQGGPLDHGIDVVVRPIIEIYNLDKSIIIEFEIYNLACKSLKSKAVKFKLRAWDGPYPRDWGLRTEVLGLLLVSIKLKIGGKRTDMRCSGLRNS